MKSTFQPGSISDNRPFKRLLSAPSTWPVWAHHLIFWISYTTFWHFVSVPNPWSWGSVISSAIFTLVNAGAAYFNLYILMPFLLREGKYLSYVGALVGAIALASILLMGLLYGWISLAAPGAAEDLLEEGPTIFVGPAIGSNSTAIFVTMGISLIHQKLQMEKRQKELEREKLETELKFLRSQLNPHFLFNALNSIFFLIKKDPDAASNALAGFSDLLRYQLYESNEAAIPLEQEMNYLRQYIHLAQLRKSKSLELDLQLPRQQNGERIPPLLLQPLVENAFKHVAQKNGKIHINGEVRNRELHFHIANNYEPPFSLTESAPQKSGGIGLENIRRRLQLLYPDRHQLNINRSEGFFTVDLKIEI